MDFIRGVSRAQGTLFPERLDDYISAENPVRFLDAFVDELDLKNLGFVRTPPAWTGRSPYDPKDSEVMWLIRKLHPDHKTISDFRKDNAQAFKNVFRTFAILCRDIVEHPFGTIKFWNDQRHFLVKGLEKVKGEFSLMTLAYNIKRVLTLKGVPDMIQALA